jgi:hypothetical protein
MPAVTKARNFIEILRGILSDLNKLSDEQLQALMNNEAKFELVELKQKEDKASSFSQAKINEIIDFLKSCNSVEEAKLYIEKQKLTVPKLKEIAKSINAPLPTKKKADIINVLVEITIGARLRYESIQNT